MTRHLSEICSSGCLLLLAGYALWPPGNVYWSPVAAKLGLFSTIALVMALFAVVGAVVALWTDVSIPNVAIGGAVAYTVALVLLASLVAPLGVGGYAFVYAVFFCCFVLAVPATRSVRNGGRRGRATP